MRALTAPRLLIIDRDGVINAESSGFIKRASEWIPLPGSLRAMGLATQAGFRVFVVSNQSGLARSMFSIDDLHHIHHKLRHEVALHGGVIDAFFFCPHDPTENCKCRKPQPGLVSEVLSRSGLPANNAIMIGDRESDFLAARAAGIQAMLVLTGHGAATVAAWGNECPCPVAANLAAAISMLCAGNC
ncbi:MAG: D-glycero-beta-D-manno-heptose 1,7-bisphosphate 7-phosphatase [Gammaproteobacteria bacterium]|nr:D-glycero-beta-D-manno-heptose 1,7-bisphosphate 7-phosphatase [Gammaproteobacteria bacterium]